MLNKQGLLTWVTSLLQNQLPGYLYYHNLDHTLYVLEKAMEIGAAENCSDAELDLLYGAALLHDTGYLHTYKGHEEAGCTLAKEYLPSYGYADMDIESICGMIRATRVGQLPQNKLEQILVDADLEYLGTKDPAVKASALFMELKHFSPALQRENWNKQQIAFLKEHHYFTAYCKKMKEPLKQEYLKSLQQP